MVFSDQTYSVLVVSAAQKFNEAFAAMLPGSEYYPVRFVGNIAAARREMVNKTYDLVIINAPLPDDFGTRFAIDACNRPAPWRCCWQSRMFTMRWKPSSPVRACSRWQSPRPLCC